MSKTKITTVPYDDEGNLKHWHSGTGADWRPNTPFRATLTFETRKRTYGQEGKYCFWLDQDGHRFPMFLSTLPDLVQRSTITAGTVTAVWMVEKKGYGYGVRLAKEDEYNW
jgi:hypothetical protein